MSLSQINFTFQINSTQDFKAILAESEAMFVINYMESLSVEGTIKKISAMTLDSTSCWSNATLNYNMDYRNASINVSVVPLNCKIPANVNVSL